jgi:streptogramin lyase
MPRDRLTGSGLGPKVSARALGVVLAGVVFVWLLLGSSAGAFGLGVARGAAVGKITEFPLPTPLSEPRNIAAGTDGNFWFTEFGAIGRITPDGTVTSYPVTDPTDVAAGPDGNVWFTNNYGTIGRITPSGTITSYSIPTANSSPAGLAAGTDGNLWFTESQGEKIGRITPTGTITEYPLPAGNTQPAQITAAKDGTLWFTQIGAHKIGRITPVGDVIEYPLPGDSEAEGIAAGPDGNVWFTDQINREVGRITPQGQVTEYPLPTGDGAPDGIAAGPDGDLWFTEADNVGRIAPDGQIIDYPLPTADGGSGGIAAGPDGNVWFAEQEGNRIGRIITGAGAAVVQAPSVTVPVRRGVPASCQGEQWADWAGQQPAQGAPSATPPGVQWSLDGTPITGATGQSYTPVAGDVGHELACTVTATYQLLHVTLSTTSAGMNVTSRPTPVREFPAGTASSGIAAGVDGNLWFTEFNGNQIARITLAGKITQYPVPTGGAKPDGITVGPDGNLWFAEWGGDQIGRITPAGKITEYSVSTANSDPSGIATGPDGNLWFTEPGGDQIGRITPAGQITEYPVPTAGSSPDDITAGPDGNLWFTERYGNQIGRITPAGLITEYPLPTPGSQPIGIMAGPDGDLWFTEAINDEIGRITPSGQITEYDVPTGNSYPWGIAAGPDGNLWFTENGGSNIGQVLTGAAGASVSSPHVIGSGRQGTQQTCGGEIWAHWAGEQPVPNPPTATPPGVQWLLDGSPIAAANGETYTPVAGDVGHQLACAVSATYRLLRATVLATSAGVPVLAPTPTPSPTPTPKPKPGRPTASHVSVSNIATASPRLSFTVTAGDNADPIKSIAVESPHGIGFTQQTNNPASGISVSTPAGEQLKYHPKISHRQLTITLANNANSVRVKIIKPAITVTKTLARQAKHNQVKKLRFVVKVTDTAKITTKLTLRNVKH